MSVAISIENVIKRFGKDTIINGLSLDVRPGEFFTLLGPSGCGKTTLLRMIIGFNSIEGGEIKIDGKVINNIPTNKRNMGMVFQNYAIFPHMTVAKNVAYGLKNRKTPKDEIARETDRFLEIMQIKQYADRLPENLSGGQQQRVALARMLAARPGILMLDEPFSALDAHLKSVLEQNLVSLFDAFHGTVLYVSHDIDEALRFCDRIAVVEAGRITETGTGDDLVNRPQSLAGVKLSGCKNATAAVRTGEHRVRLPKWGIEAATSAAVPEDVKALGVRAFFLQRVDGPGENCYRVRVDRVSDSRFERTVLLGFLDRDESEAPTVSRTDDEMKYLHQHLFWRVDKLAVPVDELPHEGEELWIRIPPDKVYLVSR